MAAIDFGKPFGLDTQQINKIDWKLTLQRVSNDLRSDFIYAPHLGFLYAKAADELIDAVQKQLKAGQFSPGTPITIEVPKSTRLRVIGANRTAGSFSRPGSILLPWDRILYQALADQAAPIISAKLDGARSFSHKIEDMKSSTMFVPTRTSWNNLQRALAKYSENKKINYVLKVDVANYFGSLNQHKLINVLSDSGYPQALSSRLEVLLLAFTGERSSRGILQGMYPSDLLGNFYLAPVDRFLSELEVASARYVDDLYVFVETVDDAENLLRSLIPTLRSYDLVLNEHKSVIMLKSQLITEEPDLEALFDAAVEEVSSQLDEEDFDVDYGFQSEWDEYDEEDSYHDTVRNNDEEQEKNDESLELQATMYLFDSIGKYPGHEESIERFCLPLFAISASDYAVEHVLRAFKKRPSMAQIYAAYLAKFLDNPVVLEFLANLLNDKSLVDWQKMWVLAALSQVDRATDATVKIAHNILKDPERHDALRAVAAIYVGRFGDHARRIALAAIYPNVSDYVKSAIYFSTRAWPGVERGNAKGNWGAHNTLNQLLTIAMGKK